MVDGIHWDELNHLALMLNSASLNVTTLRTGISEGA